MIPLRGYEPPEGALPPPEVKILSLRAEPWPDNGRRVRISLDMTPFLERPNLDLVISDENGEEVSSVNIIESIEARMTFTMHIRSPEVQGTYKLSATIVYPDAGIVDQKEITFDTFEQKE